MTAMWRVYKREWLIMHTSLATGAAGQTECTAWFEEHFEGRVREEDWRVAQHRACDRAQLQLLLPNCRGEFRFETDARIRKTEIGGQQVVEAGSAEERELLSYGTRRLRQD